MYSMHDIHVQLDHYLYQSNQFLHHFQAHAISLEWQNKRRGRKCNFSVLKLILRKRVFTLANIQMFHVPTESDLKG